MLRYLDSFFITLFLCCGVIVLGTAGCSKAPTKKTGENQLATTQTRENPTMADEFQSTPPVRVTLKTNQGVIVIELDAVKSPVTVENFLSYVNEGFYDGTIFHRVIPNFMVQGGGMDEQMQNKPTHPPIVNEAANGLKNDRGTLAMARTSNPDSASSQFFINVKNNAFLNYAGPSNPGYAVFGRVIEGMDVADTIATVKATTVGHHQNVPVEPVIIESVRVLSD